MKCLDDIFYDEFRVMMRQLKVQCGPKSIVPIVDANGKVIKDDFPIPEEFLQDTHIIKTHLVAINNITEDYYSALNGTTGLYYSKMNVTQRKFDYKGEYIKDENGDYVVEHVSVPNDCIAVFSEKPIGVPYKYKPKEAGFAYVDKAPMQVGNVKQDLLLYIIPRKYCYYVNQTALVFTTTKFGENSEKGRFYSGREIAMTNGTTLFMYVIPYKPFKKYGYRVVATSTHPNNLMDLANKIYKYWVEKGLAFNPLMCDVSGGTKGVENMARRDIQGNISVYTYANDKSIDNETDYEINYDDADAEFSDDNELETTDYNFDDLD